MNRAGTGAKPGLQQPAGHLHPTSGLPALLCQQLAATNGLAGSAQPLLEDERNGLCRLGIQQLVLPAEFLPARWRIILLHAVDEPLQYRH
jgi:hypothetical protein